MSDDRPGDDRTPRRQLISVVTPVYNEEGVVHLFHERAVKVMSQLPSMDYEIVFVDDGSKDGSCVRLREIALADPHVKVVKLSRNFGHQLAITAGVDVAQGDAVIVMDSDLQDPPEVIPEFIREWQSGYDVVYGVRRQREGETQFKLLTAGLFYRLLRMMVKIDIPLDTGDFRLMSKRAATHLRELREHDRFVRGLVSWIGFRQKGLLYDREPRNIGQTKFPLRKMMTFAIDGITSFTNVPLKAAIWLGYAASLVSFIYLCSVFVQKAMGITQPGWSTIMVAMLFMGGVQLICIGILGEYIGRIFIQSKQRPLYIIEEVFQSPEPPEASELTPAAAPLEREVRQVTTSTT